MKLKCIDAFCGAGGLSLGLSKSGFDIIISFDNDNKCIETLKKNKKYIKHNAVACSIQEFNKTSKINPIIKRGDLDLLAGGPPCQGFSIQRIGSDKDARNSLVLEYFKLIENLFPKFFLMENVPGLLGKRGEIFMETFLEKAGKLGYHIHQKVIDAKDFSIAQRRKRVFIVGERTDLNGPHFKFPPPSKKIITVREAIGHLPSPGSGENSIPNHNADNLSELNKRRLLALKEGQGRDYLPDELLADCHKLSSSKIGHGNVYGRMKWDDVSPTITARFDSFTRGMFGHPLELRSISLREGAILQTFPIDYEFIGTKVEVARQIGNAVPPKLAEKIGDAILKAIKCSQHSA